ncbi:hypothetical protein KS4_14720 [Poriferisphaera corsica]|uniref:PEP-CTERM protein-sorting domain-containing protein n=1 Tax=Poriferisphaera corsica TaxID=2528020 RepID=A0A517YT75_9BACT|nr:PEP-CTERM sorting domain-containing protein [Poriferisphaera corsica]QDU33426.1 hypothetical protein KS4_14720 [Poriferisphaera corsica]
MPTISLTTLFRKTTLLCLSSLFASALLSTTSNAILLPDTSLDYFTKFQEVNGNNPTATITKGAYSVDFTGHIGIRPDGPLYFQDARSFWTEEDNIDSTAILSHAANHMQFVARDRVLPGNADPNGTISFFNASNSLINVDIEVYDALSNALLASDPNHGSNKSTITLSNDWVRYVITPTDNTQSISRLLLTNDDDTGRSAIDNFGFVVPEPASASLLALGTLSLFVRSRKKR